MLPKTPPSAWWLGTRETIEPGTLLTAPHGAQGASDDSDWVLVTPDHDIAVWAAQRGAEGTGHPVVAKVQPLDEIHDDLGAKDCEEGFVFRTKSVLVLDVEPLSVDEQIDHLVRD